MAETTTPKLILLDVYETILDMGDVESRVNDITDSKRGYTIWLELFMQYAFVDNCIGEFHDFASIGKATLNMTLKMLGEKADDNKINSVIELLKHLPLQDDARKGLSELSDKFRMAALTNSSVDIVRERMESSGLISYFEAVLSAEQLKKYKPALEVYQWAANRLKLEPAEIVMVSSHPWDIAGAANAGMQTAFILRNRQMLYPLATKPNYECKSLIELVEKLKVPAGA